MADKTIGELPNLPAISPLDLLVAQHNEEATKITGATLTNFFKDYIGPVAATSASQMTNTNKVYIYIGNESGYTNGNWYYYNGSSWVSGGAYNSQAVNTDATLTHEGVPADAEAAGKIVEISETQPAAPANRVWIPETQEATVQVPTWAEHEELADDISDLNGAMTDFENALTLDSFTQIEMVDNAYVSNTDGSFIAYNGWQRTGYISVDDSGTWILATLAGSAYSAVYDANKSFVRALEVNQIYTELTFASTEKYIALSFFGMANYVAIKKKTLADNFTAHSLKVLQFNCGGYNYGTTPKGLPNNTYDTKVVNYRRFYGETLPTLFFLQEAKENLKQTGGTNETASNYALYRNWFPYFFGNQEVSMIYSTIPIYDKASVTLSSGRTAYTAKTKLLDTEIFLMNVHLHPSNATTRATETTEIINMMKAHNYVIVSGDFNYAPDGEDTTQYARFTAENYVLANKGFFGSWWTWSSNQTDFANYDNPTGTVWYIDNIIISNNLRFKNVYCPNTYAKLSSDHIPCVAEISLY